MGNSKKCHADWFLRIALAGVFLFHGAIKFPILDVLSEVMGLPIWLIALAGSAEIVAALCLLIGGVKRNLPTLDIVAGLLLAGMMTYAASLHFGQWNFLPSASHPNGGMEFQVTLALMGLYFVFSGCCRLKHMNEQV